MTTRHQRITAIRHECRSRERSGGRVTREEGADDVRAAQRNKLLVGVKRVTELSGEDLAQRERDDVVHDA